MDYVHAVQVSFAWLTGNQAILARAKLEEYHRTSQFSDHIALRGNELGVDTGVTLCTP